MLVIRKTWGFKKKEDWISLSQFTNSTLRSKSSVVFALNRLVRKNVLVRKTKRGIRTSYRFNKKFNNWKKLVRKTELVRKTVPTSTENRTQLVRKTGHTKETITKETIQKKELVEKITSWAYKRASTPPSCSKEAFITAVTKAINRAGEVEVRRRFSRETNAINFLRSLKTL